MKQVLRKAFVPVMAATIILTATATSHAQWFGLYFGSYYPSYSYSSYYSPYYSSYYTPTYSSYYSPSYYSASYAPSVAYYGGSCSSGCCGTQRTYSISSGCCSPCSSCVSCNSCCSPCSACGSCDCSGDCDLASSNSQNSDPTPVQKRNDSGQRNRTFLEEEDQGTGDQRYENPSPGGNGDGFTPRNSNGSEPDPLDRSFGTSSAGGRDELRFKFPNSDINRPETTPNQRLEFKSPTRRIKIEDSEKPNFPLLKLDEKMTSRSMPQRTRLVQRRSWQQPVIARTETDRGPSEINLGWVPLPAPARLVQK